MLFDEFSRLLLYSFPIIIQLSDSDMQRKTEPVEIFCVKLCFVYFFLNNK
jgi:hypothetical protein